MSLWFCVWFSHDLTSWWWQMQKQAQRNVALNCVLNVDITFFHIRVKNTGYKSNFLGDIFLILNHCTAGVETTAAERCIELPAMCCWASEKVWVKRRSWKCQINANPGESRIFIALRTFWRQIPWFQSSALCLIIFWHLKDIPRWFNMFRCRWGCNFLIICPLTIPSHRMQWALFSQGDSPILLFPIGSPSTLAIVLRAYYCI